MVDRTAMQTQAATSRAITSRARYAGQFIAWVIVHSMSAAGRAMCCLPAGESPIARPRWWRAEVRGGLADVDRYLAQQPRQR
jgi:hypothetical protein